MNVPRLPTVLQVMKVKSDRIVKVSLDQLGLTPTARAGRDGGARPRSRSGAVERKRIVLDGPPRRALRSSSRRCGRKGCCDGRPVRRQRGLRRRPAARGRRGAASSPARTAVVEAVAAARTTDRLAPAGRHGRAARRRSSAASPTRSSCTTAPASGCAATCGRRACSTPSGDGADGVFVADAPAAREAAGRRRPPPAARRAPACATRSTRGRGRPVPATRSIYGGVADGTHLAAGRAGRCASSPPASSTGEAAGGGAVDRAPVQAPAPALSASRRRGAGRQDRRPGRRAAVVVSVGRGFAKAEDLDLVKPLVERARRGAGLLAAHRRGLQVAAARSARSASPGSSVNAGLYLALGISGQVQHLAGIKGAKVVVSVNNDARAPIIAQRRLRRSSATSTRWSPSS